MGWRRWVGLKGLTLKQQQNLLTHLIQLEGKIRTHISDEGDEFITSLPDVVLSQELAESIRLCSGREPSQWFLGKERV